MQRREFVGQIALGSLLGAVANAQPSSISAKDASADAPASRKLATTPPVLMAPQPTAIEVIWGVSELCKGKVEWKEPGGATGIADSDPFGMVPQGSKVIRVPIQGLVPGASYELRSITTSVVGSVTQTSEWKTFRTIDPSAAETRFVVWNDTHVNNATIQALHQATPAADFLIWNGDTCNDWTREELLIPTLLHPGECDFTNGRPLMLVWGNHDVRGQWAYQLPDMVATPSGRPFYAFRSGPVAVICLHTGEDKPDDHPSFGGRVAFDELRQEQSEWLEKVIESPALRDAPYRLVFCHIPLRWSTERVPDYNQGGYDMISLRSRDAWHAALVKWGTQLVISGHTHKHALIDATVEFPYAQLVGGGPATENATWIDADADATRLQLRTIKLDGTEAEKLTLSPIG